MTAERVAALGLLALTGCGAPADTGDTAAMPPADPDFPMADCTARATGTDGASWDYRYDALENEIAASFRDPADPDADVDVRSTWSRRLLVRQERDDGADGHVDHAEAYTYDGTRVATWWVDEDGDGAPEQVYAYRYDDAGQVVGVDRDDGGDGTIDGVYAYMLDDGGHVLELTLDDGPDGVVDTRWTQDVRADGAGHTLYDQVRDDGDDGVPDRFLHYAFDASKRFVYTYADEDADGALDAGTTWAYGVDGGPDVTSATVWVADGASQTVTVRAYDTWGRDALTRITASDADPYTWTWAWACPS